MLGFKFYLYMEWRDMGVEEDIDLDGGMEMAQKYLGIRLMLQLTWGSVVDVGLSLRFSLDGLIPCAVSNLEVYKDGEHRCFTLKAH